MWVKGVLDDLGEIQETNRQCTIGINRRQLDGDECFKPRPDNKEDEEKKQLPEKRSTSDNLAKEF